MSELSLGAILGPLAAAGDALVRAARDAPVEDADSGWQFLAEGDAGELSGAQPLTLAQVVAREPSLAPRLDLPPGTTLRRPSPGLPWLAESA